MSEEIKVTEDDMTKAEENIQAAEFGKEVKIQMGVDQLLDTVVAIINKQSPTKESVTEAAKFLVANPDILEEGGEYVTEQQKLVDTATHPTAREQDKIKGIQNPGTLRRPHQPWIPLLEKLSEESSSNQ